MFGKRLCIWLCVLAFAAATPVWADTPWISAKPVKGEINLANAGIVYDPNDAEVVAIAAQDLAADITRVTGKTPHGNAQQVWIGTLGHSAIIDGLKIDTAALNGCWECYLITTVAHPKPGVDAALVIVGSDRRGTAYGVYEVSQAIGVSPWYWWADVTPRHQDALYVKPGMRQFGPPSVTYRGIFINDEDWGLEPWAAKTFDPDTGNLGPRTYAKVFELLLRLKANTLWPAMHAVSKPFNADPENARLADRYAIVMGSSHAEPMLRNNVGEWTDKPEQFNYATNPAGVDAYWRERLKANGRYENVYTLGMRGIHDSAMQGAKTLPDKTDLLNRVIASQRQMLSEEVAKDVTHVPQIFVPYKEVLDVYHGGLNIPDDVTLMWPDDNFGYIRHFPNAAEKARSGGSGVYYHLSYLGAPLSYIWLSTTPPALIQSELTRAYDSGADRIWIANVGDIKPAEADLSYFMALAWDVPGVRQKSQAHWLSDFAAQTFGPAVARDMGALWNDYYSVNSLRRPEHLQWYLPKQPRSASPLTATEITARLKAMDRLALNVAKLASRIAPEQQDAFFELVDYPARATALSNRRYFALECLNTPAKACAAPKDGFLSDAQVADASLKALTERYNHQIAGGKWAGMLNEEPADNQWTSFRIARPSLNDQTPMAYDPPAAFIYLTPTPAEGWTPVAGLGRTGAVMRSSGDGDKPLTFAYVAKPGEKSEIAVSILPTYPADDSQAWTVDVQVNDGPRVPLVFDRSRQDKAWAQGVLDNRLIQSLPGSFDGKLSIRVFSAQKGLMVEGVAVRMAASR